MPLSFIFLSLFTSHTFLMITLIIILYVALYVTIIIVDTVYRHGVRLGKLGGNMTTRIPTKEQAFRIGEQDALLHRESHCPRFFWHLAKTYNAGYTSGLIRNATNQGVSIHESHYSK